MTLHATRDGQTITIHGNTHVTLDIALGGAGTPHTPHIVMNDGYAQHVRITEDVQHVRYFHNQLGQLLDQAEAERITSQDSPVTLTRDEKAAEVASFLTGGHSQER